MFVLGRLLQIFVSFWIVTVIVFILTELIGDPVALLLGPDAPKSEYDRIRAALGYDRPAIVRYGDFVGGILTGDWGESIMFRRPAIEVVLERLPITATIAVGATAVSLLVAIPLGAVAGMRPGTLTDRASVLIATLGQVVPGFLIAMILILVFGVMLRWFPAGGIGDWRYYVLPTLALGAWSLAAVTRLTRSGVRETLGQPFVTLARSKGMRDGALLRRHVLRAASLPVITYGGLQVGMLLNGSVITETVFAMPGVGKLAIDAVAQRDLAVVQAVVIFGALVYLLISLVVDSIYVYADPRIKYRSAR